MGQPASGGVGPGDRLIPALREQWRQPVLVSRRWLSMRAEQTGAMDAGNNQRLPGVVLGELELPLPREPLVSIVVPVFNNIEVTLACLRSIAGAGADAPFEVIVVDDASTDPLSARLGGMMGVRHLRNAENVGFVGSCNAGAAAARGEFVVFLNNDTLVTVGWLDHLVEVVQQPEVGLVGARLCYPDGSLQEAGGIVFSDGSGWNYGRGGNPKDPRFLSRRDTDYCSGAAIAIARRLFEQLGGFDERYSPGYYEDTDLAMQVRACGARVVYEPRAVVIHVEGASAGTDLATGMKAHQVVNSRKFLERWRTELECLHPSPGTDPDMAVRRNARYRIVAVYGAEHEHGNWHALRLLEDLAKHGCAIDLHLLGRLPEAEESRLNAAGIYVWTPEWHKTGLWVLTKIGRSNDAVISDGSEASCRWMQTNLKLLVGATQLTLRPDDNLGRLLKCLEAG